MLTRAFRCALCSIPNYCIPHTRQPGAHANQLTLSTTSALSFSNTFTGDLPADPYKAANMDTNATIKEKVEGLSDFISHCKFGMMTTRDSGSGNLISRCMALAAKDEKHFFVLF